MKILNYIFLLGAIVVLLSCNDNEANVQLNTNTELSFSGTFKTIDSDDVSGIVSLNISGGQYSCATNLPFGSGAGKMEVNESTLNFVDTLFFPIPAIYGPSYVLSGQHQYTFDGDILKIWRSKNAGEIEYELKLIK